MNDNTKNEVMAKIFQKCKVDDIKWILKIILKDLRIGLKHEKILNVYHPEANDLYNLTSNLRKVAEEF